jgi:tRNA threonylcarbamoyladenosine biosynthesis protein TsaE
VSLWLPDEAATAVLAERLDACLPPDRSGWTVLLAGELGAGKSTLVRALLYAMGHTGPVPSPTYTLVEPYDFPTNSVYHIDLYRVSDEAELRYLGFNELDEGFRLVEWPERAPGLAEQADLAITLAYRDDGREVEVKGLSERGRRVAACVGESILPQD